MRRSRNRIEPLNQHCMQIDIPFSSLSLSAISITEHPILHHLYHSVY